MKKAVIYLLLIIFTLIVGCMQGLDESTADIALRSSTIVSKKPTSSGKYLVRYKLVEVIKGKLEPGMLDTNGILTYEYYTEKPDAILSSYIFYIKKHGNKFDGFWHNCELVITLDIDNL